MYFRFFVMISPWKRAGHFIWINLNPLHPRMLCAKFGWNWLIGSREEDEIWKVDRQADKTDRRRTTGDLHFQLRWAKNRWDFNVNCLNTQTTRYPIGIIITGNFFKILSSTFWHVHLAYLTYMIVNFYLNYDFFKIFLFFLLYLTSPLDYKTQDVGTCMTCIYPIPI